LNPYTKIEGSYLHRNLLNTSLFTHDLKLYRDKIFRPDQDYLSSQKSKELIESFVQSNGKVSKNDIADYINGKQVPLEYRLSRKSAYKIIEEMSKDRLKILKPKRQSQTHYVSINDKSQFHSITQELADLKKLLSSLNDNVPKNLATIKRINDKTTSIDNHFRNVVQVAQNVIFSVVTDLVSSIEKDIVSGDDKQVLYLSLWEVLKTGNKLNRIMFPEVFSQTTHLPSEMETIKVVPGTTYYNIVMSVIDPFTEFIS